MKRIFAGVMLLCLFFLPGPVKAAPALGDVIYNHILRYQRPEVANIVTGDILRYSAKYDVDPLLITALFTQESSFDMKAVSPTGAMVLLNCSQKQPRC